MVRGCGIIIPLPLARAASRYAREPRIMTRTRYVLLFLVSILFASPAFATLTGFSGVPPQPTVCDSVTLEAQGVLPTSCYDVVSAVLRGPVPVVCPTEPC